MRASWRSIARFRLSDVLGRAKAAARKKSVSKPLFNRTPGHRRSHCSLTVKTNPNRSFAIPAWNAEPIFGYTGTTGSIASAFKAVIEVFPLITRRWVDQIRLSRSFRIHSLFKRVWGLGRYQTLIWPWRRPHRGYDVRI